MEQNQLIKNASYVSVATGVIIFLIKALGWANSQSISLFASLIDSLLDVTSSILNAIAIQIALSPPDEKHRFGHNKVQDLAIFAQSIFFISSGGFTLFISIKKLLSKQHIQNYEQGILSMILCSSICVALVLYQSYVIKKTQSSIIRSDRAHYLSDLLSNFGVIISIIGSNYYAYLDGIFGILISFYIMYAAYDLLKHSIGNLIDAEFTAKDKAIVFKIIKNDTAILGVHDMKTRYAGDKAFIQMHIDLDPHISLIEAHTISENLTHNLLEAFPNGEVIIHQDPIGHDKKIEHRENIA